MTDTMQQIAHQHHERITTHLDAMPGVADRLLHAPQNEVRAALASVRTFLDVTLLPHVEAAEATIYPELERMFQNRHSMSAMRREHDEVRRLVREFDRLDDQLQGEPVTLSRTLGVRRVMFQLFALVKVHLAEEETYARMIDRGVTDDIAAVLAAGLEHPIAR
ncbi:MAG TPA: hemerythrin domain-containing protein [Candidatus Limnocylindrales bacterium]|nr:hemerythrin domain-containing protein [Candidatus Limnocylindrales bacterium]